MILLLTQVANHFISRTDINDCSDLIFLCSIPAMVLVKAEKKDFIIKAFKDSGLCFLLLGTLGW
jgi:hypothetical protein